MVASEAMPFCKTGGLADVLGALPVALQQRGEQVAVVLPAYRVNNYPGPLREAYRNLWIPLGTGFNVDIFERIERGVTFYFVNCPQLFDRDGIYASNGSWGYSDNHLRYATLSMAATGVARYLFRPDIINCHDWQSALVPLYLRHNFRNDPTFYGIKLLFTIHNLGYQGIHDAWVLGVAGFPRELFYPASPFEFWGRVNFMKVGLSFADLLSTVSPRYAQEIQSNGEFGFGLEGVLRRRSADLRGILNGIDDQTWNPARDPYLPAAYDADRLEGKAAVREALAAACGFDGNHRPLVGVISRLVEQKGFDLIEQAEAELLKLEARYVVLGLGQPRYEELFRRLAREHPQRVHYRAEQNEAFAHLIEGGSDLFLMPTRYEPCGLNQMYSLRYGTVPVVRAVGGLADTVQEFDLKSGEGTGFRFQRYEAAEMVAALKRALAIGRQPALWTNLQRNGMRRDFSWRASADGYDALYAEARARVAGGRVPTLESVRAGG